MTHPRRSLDEVLNSPIRYSVVAALAVGDRVEFRFIRDAVEVSDSVLSKMVATLEDAGYVTVERTFVGRRRRTYLTLTARGRTAFQTHTRALQDIAEGASLPTPPDRES